MKKDVDVAGALTALDMVHATLWKIQEDLKDGAIKRIVNPIEVTCLLLLVEAAMKDLGFEKGFKK